MKLVRFAALATLVILPKRADEPLLHYKLRVLFFWYLLQMGGLAVAMLFGWIR